MDFFIPDGWTLPSKNTICYCLGCGMIYYANTSSQADYDVYYRERYGFNGSLNDGVTKERLEELVELICKHFPRKDVSIVDYGGGSGYLVRRLQELRYFNVLNVEVDDVLPVAVDMIVSAQVFEHLFDLRGTLDKLVKSIRPSGRFLIEIPDALAYSTKSAPPILDYQKLHINHFGPSQLDLLFFNAGYERAFAVQKHCRPGNEFDSGMPIYRALYTPRNPELSYRPSKIHVQTAMENIVKQLRDIKTPVIVWGCGDMCMHVLSQAKLNVVYFVDISPIYKGTTIKGVPVLGRVVSNEPIVVIAQYQTSSILKSIGDAGLKNKVIAVWSAPPK
jgi:hypothetical protein